MNGRRITLTMAAALALVAGGTAAGAAIESGPVDSSGVVHGCYTTNAINGSHFFVLQDAGTRCPRRTTAIMWNQQGPQGPQGFPGAQGAAGPQGPAGTSGWSGQVQLTENQNNSLTSAEILSQAGPSTLSVTIDHAGPGIIFTGSNLPTNMYPFATATINTIGIQWLDWVNVANTSFELEMFGSEPSATLVFDYFLPAD
jgi:hypothetical protein